MTAQSVEQLRARKCVPCEGGVPRLSLAEAKAQLARLQGWSIADEGERIRKEWTFPNFVSGMAFLNNVAEVAEADGHHPDLHLTAYRHVAIEIWTHAIGGLSDNDFILAAKIDGLPVDAKPGRQ